MAWVRYDDNDTELDAVAGLSHVAFRLRFAMVELSQRLDTRGILTRVQADGICRRINVGKKCLDELTKAGIITENLLGYEIIDHVARHGRPPAKDPDAAERKRRQREKEAEEAAERERHLRDNTRDVTRDKNVTSRSHARVLTIPDLTIPVSDSLLTNHPGGLGGGEVVGVDEPAIDSASAAGEAALSAEGFIAAVLAEHEDWTGPLAAVRVPNPLKPGATVATFHCGVLRRWIALGGPERLYNPAPRAVKLDEGLATIRAVQAQMIGELDTTTQTGDYDQ